MISWRKIFGPGSGGGDTPPLHPALEDIRQAADGQRGAQPSNALKNALNDFADLDELNNGQKVDGIMTLLDRVSSPSGAGFLAVWLGTWVEGGGDPDVTLPMIVDCFMKWAKTIITADPEDEDAVAPEVDADTVQGIDYFGNALVAHLSRAPETLEKLKQNAAFVAELERLNGITAGANWVLTLLQQCSGDLTVLNVKERIGARVRYENIANCFHLFTLLQGALEDVMPDAQAADEETLMIARGQMDGGCSDAAWWHYGQPYAPEANIAASVWGEGSPGDIGSIDGEQVLLLWPPVLGSRTWDGGFFGPILHASLPSVTLVDILDEKACDRWWARLKLRQPT